VAIRPIRLFDKKSLSGRTRWRMAQSVANQSLMFEFPDKQGENRELSISGPFSRGAHAEWSRIYKGFLTEFPTQPSREFWSLNRELFRPDQGVFRAEQGIRSLGQQIQWE
jgi:hypothetical protein